MLLTQTIIFECANHLMASIEMWKFLFFFYAVQSCSSFDKYLREKQLKKEAKTLWMIRSLKIISSLWTRKFTKSSRNYTACDLREKIRDNAGKIPSQLHNKCHHLTSINKRTSFVLPAQDESSLTENNSMIEPIAARWCQSKSLGIMGDRILCVMKQKTEERIVNECHVSKCFFNDVTRSKHKTQKRM